MLLWGDEVVSERNACAENVVTDVKSIDVREDDFESVLVDGCLGFSLSAGNAVLMVVLSMFHAGSYVMLGIVAAASALVAMLLLFGGSQLTDVFQGTLGRRIILVSHACTFVAACAFMILGIHVVSAAFASAGVITTSFLYGRYLAILVRKALMLLIDVLFMYVGAMMLIASQLDFSIAAFALAVSVLISLSVSFVFSKRKYQYDAFVSAADSKDRSIKVKGNNHTLFLIGFMFTGGLFALFVNVQMEYIVIALGVAVSFAGVISLLSRQLDERWYKESLKKGAAFVAALFLLPIPLVPDEAKIVILALYMCVVSLNVIVVLNAMVETTRFNQISPVWLFGQEGAVFFSGVLLGGALITMGFMVSVNMVDDVVHAGLGQHIALVIMVILCSWVQIRVNYQVYPFEPVIETELDEETTAQIEKEGKRKLMWHKKVETACDKYRLSPREREVLWILLKGRDAKYIMDKFYISQSTAKTHIYNIYRKFGIHSRQELIDFVEEIDLEEFEEMPAS